jgi:hypothetical protein
MQINSPYLKSYIEEADKAVLNGRTPDTLNEFLVKKVDSWYKYEQLENLEDSLQEIGWVSQNFPLFLRGNPYWRFNLNDSFRLHVWKMAQGQVL